MNIAHGQDGQEKKDAFMAIREQMKQTKMKARQQMSNRIEDYTDEELVLHYRDMQHLSVDASTKEGLDYLRYYQRNG